MYFNMICFYQYLSHFLFLRLSIKAKPLITWQSVQRCLQMTGSKHNFSVSDIRNRQSLVRELQDRTGYTGQSAHAPLLHEARHWSVNF